MGGRRKSINRNRAILISATGGMILLGNVFAVAQTGTSTQPGGGVWSDADAWTPPGPPTSGAALLGAFGVGSATIDYDLPTVTNLTIFGERSHAHVLTFNLNQGGINASSQFVVGIPDVSGPGGNFVVNLGNATISTPLLVIA